MDLQKGQKNMAIEELEQVWNSADAVATRAVVILEY